MIKKLSMQAHIKTIAVIVIGILLVLAAFPIQSEATVVKKKSKVTYTLSVDNINSDTVIKKGNSKKIQYKATKTRSGVTKGTKVRFKSSNKKIATVSSKGVIKAKKNGTVKITVYCKSKPSKRKTIKIRVGTPVSSIKINGYQHLRAGRKTAFKAKPNSNATNKKVLWKTDKPSVVKVDRSGNITALKNGTATISAIAADGSGTKCSIKISVHKYTSTDARWIAHRGLHTYAIENTADAFRAAGQAGGFWGCECDIWETKHETMTIEVPVQSVDQQSSDIYTEENSEETNQGEGIVQDNEEESEQTDVVDIVQSADQQQSDVIEENTEETKETIKADEEEPEQTVADETPATETVNVDTFDLVINHDDTFKRTLGVNRYVRSMTATEIKQQIPKACFFDEYLDICKQYNMVPVIEFKDPQMSEAAINKAIQMLDERGQLDKALLISFYPYVLEKVKACADSKLGGKISYTAFLNGESTIEPALNTTRQKNFGCVSLQYGQLDKKAYDKCKAEGVRVGTWTYGDTPYNDEMLYRHLLSGQYELDFATIDYKPW